MNRALKITDGTNTKRTEFPISFDNLVALVAGWIPIDSDKVYTFKDTQTLSYQTTLIIKSSKILHKVEHQNFL